MIITQRLCELDREANCWYEPPQLMFNHYLWPPLVSYLHEHHNRVVLVSPLSTCHARPAKSGTFSRTDSKDAFLIADLARQGTFHFHEDYTPEEEAMHRLAISYDKLRKVCSATTPASEHRSMDRHGPLFPELLKVLKLDSLTARHLLQRYLLPEEYLTLDLDREADRLMDISRNQHGRETLLRLQVLARRSVGVPQSDPGRTAQRLTVDAWLSMIDALEAQIRSVEGELVRLSRETPYHAPLVSLKGISDLLAALFIAEVRDPSRFPRPKQIERLAGCNLHVHDSGTYKGRRITHLGGSRLRWVLYQMAS